MKKFNVDYYVTEGGDECKIVDKLKFSVIASSNDLSDNFDIFVKKTDVKTQPTKHDMTFFLKELKFYTVQDVDDAGDFYIVNVDKCKAK